MGRAPGTGDDDLEALTLGALGEGIKPLWRAMGRDDPCVACDAELGQRVHRMAHGLPVRLASHDDGDGCGHKLNSSRESRSIGPIIVSGLTAARRGKGIGMHYPVLVKSGKPGVAVPNQNRTGITSFACPFESELRKRRKMMRTSDSGHYGPQQGCS